MYYFIYQYTCTRVFGALVGFRMLRWQWIWFWYRRRERASCLSQSPLPHTSQSLSCLLLLLVLPFNLARWLRVHKSVEFPILTALGHSSLELARIYAQLPQPRLLPPFFYLSHSLVTSFLAKCTTLLLSRSRVLSLASSLSLFLSHSNFLVSLSLYGKLARVTHFPWRET